VNQLNTYQFNFARSYLPANFDQNCAEKMVGNFKARELKEETVAMFVSILTIL
jgi:hypothetical protein